MLLPEQRHTGMPAFPYRLWPNPSFITTSGGGSVGGDIQATHVWSVSYIHDSEAEQRRPQQASLGKETIVAVFNKLNLS